MPVRPEGHPVPRADNSASSTAHARLCGGGTKPGSLRTFAGARCWAVDMSQQQGNRETRYTWEQLHPRLFRTVPYFLFYLLLSAHVRATVCRSHGGLQRLWPCTAANDLHWLYCSVRICLVVGQDVLESDRRGAARVCGVTQRRLELPCLRRASPPLL